MPNLTQLGSSLFLGSVVVWVDDNGVTRVAHHTDKTRNYKSDWTPQQIVDAIEGGKTEQTRMKEQWNGGHQNGLMTAKNAHNKLPWHKRIRKK